MQDVFADHQDGNHGNEHMSCSDEGREDGDGLPFAANQAVDRNNDCQGHEDERDKDRDQGVGHGEHAEGPVPGVEEHLAVLVQSLDVAVSPAEPLFEQPFDCQGCLSPRNCRVFLDDAVAKALQRKRQVSIFSKRVMGVAASLDESFPAPRCAGSRNDRNRAHQALGHARDADSGEVFQALPGGDEIAAVPDFDVTRDCPDFLAVPGCEKVAGEHLDGLRLEKRVAV